MEYRNKKIEFIKHVQDTIKYEGPEIAIKVINHELKAVKMLKIRHNLKYMKIGLKL